MLDYQRVFDPTIWSKKASDSHFCSDNNNSNSEWDILSKKHGHGCLISMAPKRYP
jgi:hypothetical protein